MTNSHHAPAKGDRYRMTGGPNKGATATVIDARPLPTVGERGTVNYPVLIDNDMFGQHWGITKLSTDLWERIE